MTSNLSEAERVDQQGVTQIADLYDIHRDVLYSYAVSILGNRHDAEDVVQMVFRKVWKGREKWSAIQQWRPWLLQLTRHTALDHIKQASRARKREELAGYDYFLETHSETSAESLERLHEVLRQLDEPSRSLILLKTVQELTFDEIGQVLQIPGSTASTRYYEAMKHLKALWEKIDQSHP